MLLPFLWLQESYGITADLHSSYATPMVCAGEKPQWGKYYHDQGADLCQNLLYYCINPVSSMPMVGDWAWGEKSQDIIDKDPGVQAQMQQRFPDGRKTATRSVDWMLAHYKTFAQVTTSPSSMWTLCMWDLRMTLAASV